MYYLCEFRGEILVVNEQVFKNYFEQKGAEILRISSSFDELIEMSENLKLI